MKEREEEEREREEEERINEIRDGTETAKQRKKGRARDTSG